MIFVQICAKCTKIGGGDLLIVYIDKCALRMIYYNCKKLYARGGSPARRKFMKKKLLLLTVLVMAFVMLLAMSVSAAEPNAEYLEKMTSGMKTVTLADGTVKDLYDSEGKALCWYCDPNNNNALTSVRAEDLVYTLDAQNVLSEIKLSDGTVLAKTSSTKTNKFVVLNLRATAITSFATDNMFKDSDNLLQHIFMPDSMVTLRSYAFGKNSALRGCYFSKNSQLTTIDGQAFLNCSNLCGFYLPSGVTTFGDGAFSACSKLFFVDSASDVITKPEVYYFPENLATLTGETLKFCQAMNTTIVFGDKLTSIANSWALAFNDSVSRNVVFLGKFTAYTASNQVKNTTYYFANKDVSFTPTNNGSNNKFYFCGASGTTHLVEKDLGTEATCITNQFVKSYCFCGTLVKDEEIANTATGIHTFVTNDCTVSVRCTGDENCVAMSPANEKHALVHTLSYANGFDKAGIYNYYCENEGCTIADKAVRDAEKSPIITFKGYSVPEMASYLGINAGYHIDTTLLSMYETLNEKKVTIGLLMVNAEDVADVSDILNAEGELVANVRGFSVTMTSNNYSDISIEIKNFQLGEEENGNYYKLSLVSALFVKVDDKIDYLQDAIGDETEGNRVTTTSGVVFDTITASRVYASKNITPQ